ncbi:MAG: YggS family pyridoxal phosphate-dependent enzyme [Bdellovibrionales bacterium]|nr:YggS family pyridoxal phosphate-dependent enzyme [Bdellovibrionales bacterium]
MSESQSTSLKELTQRLSTLLAQIEAAQRRGPHAAERVQLLAVSKTQPISRIKALIGAGHLLFGENYVQEAEEKIHALTLVDSLPRAQFHLIGNLQRNKVKRAVGLFDVIESVDRVELAQEIAKVAERRGRRQRVMMQVNTSAEDSKSGVDPQSAEQLCKDILALPALQLEGLMCIGQFIEPEADDALRRQDFIVLRELRGALQERCGVQLPELSMGMSADFELAVEEGATIVRVGSALLGERPAKD